MHPKSIGVAFDLDGTLFDSCSVSKSAMREGFKAFWTELGEDGPVPSWDDIRQFIGLPSYGFFPALLPDSHKENWRLLHKHIGLCEKKRLQEGRGLTFDGVHETLQELLKSGYFLGCLSNASEIYFDSVLDGCRLRGYFDVLVCIGEKPAIRKTDVLAEWADGLGGTTNLLYVGDRLADVEAAHEAGLRAVGVTFGYGSREELLAADAVIDRMKDLLTVLPRFFKPDN